MTGYCPRCDCVYDPTKGRHICLEGGPVPPEGAEAHPTRVALLEDVARAARTYTELDTRRTIFDRVPNEVQRRDALAALVESLRRLDNWSERVRLDS